MFEADVNRALEGTGRKPIGEGTLRESLKLPFTYDPRSGIIGLPPLVSLDTAYVEVSGTATANGQCVFGTVVKDSLGLYTTATSRVTVKTAGRYLAIASGDANAGAAHRQMVYKNGSKVRDLVSVTALFAWSGWALLELAVNDYIQIYDTAAVTAATLFQVLKVDNI